MKVSISLAVASVVILYAPTTLRYRFVPGQIRRFQTTEHSETTIRIAGAVDAITIKQDSLGKMEARVLSVSGRNGVVEERRFNERRMTESPAGKSESMVPPTTRVVTYSPLGKVLKLERKPVPGVADNRPGFLEGLAVLAPEKPVSRDDIWSGTLSVSGPDERPMPVRYVSRFLGMTQRLGHSCAQIVTTLSADFRATFRGAPGPSQGSAHGTITTYLARDLGQDVEADAEMVVSLQGPVSVAGQSGDGTTVIVSKSRIVLEK